MHLFPQWSSHMAKSEPHNRDVPPLPSQRRDWGDWADDGADPSWTSGGWSSALARLLLGAGYFRAAREEDRGRPVEAGKRRDEGARALWLAHRVRKRERVGVDGIDVRIADRPAAAVAEFRTPYSIK